MAQKEQKFNKYDQELKNQIIQDFYLSHYSYKLISIKYSIPIETLATWISHYIQIFHLNNLSIIKFALELLLLFLGFGQEHVWDFTFTLHLLFAFFSTSLNK